MLVLGAILIATDVIDTGDTTRELIPPGAARAPGFGFHAG